MWEVVAESVVDSIKMLPFLFGAYLLIEYMEHKSAGRLERGLAKYGAVGGALLGCVPQCGFSVVASNLYSERIITAGTLIAVFISTSDEAVPVLLSNPDSLKSIVAVIAIKLVLAVMAGLGMDMLIKQSKKQGKPAKSHKATHRTCSHCRGEHDNIFKSAARHTLNIFTYIFLLSVAINVFIYLVGEDNFKSLLLSGSTFQPAVAGLIGLIPNCVASVMLAELYAGGSLSFGALTAGLCTGAGAGLIVLFRENRSIRQNLGIVAYIYAVGVAAGIVLQLV